MNLDALAPAFLALCTLGLGTYYLKSIDHQMAAQLRNGGTRRSRSTFKRWGVGMLAAGVLIFVLAVFRFLDG